MTSTTAPLDRIASEVHERRARATAFVETILENPALSFFSFFCCIPVAAFAPNVSPRARFRLLGLWAGTIVLAVCVRELFGT